MLNHQQVYTAKTTELDTIFAFEYVFADQTTLFKLTDDEISWEIAVKLTH